MGGCEFEAQGAVLHVEGMGTELLGGSGGLSEANNGDSWDYMACRGVYVCLVLS